MELYTTMLNLKKVRKKQFAVLVDPDKTNQESSRELAVIARQSGVDWFFVGGSLLTQNSLDNCIKTLKEHADIPVVLFPGNTLQMSNRADGILFLSLISGRNAEMLIGRHVIAAPYLKLSTLEVISTGYMLIESGRPTTVSYMSNSVPIPADKDDIAACTAMAGEMLGLKLIFMDAGSGANNPVSESMIKAVSQSIEIPLLVGGGISTPEKATAACQAGADIIVVGNAIEKDDTLILKMAEAIKKIN
jgi:putative glycerol-1-phosphate prenyltransferase